MKNLITLLALFCIVFSAFGQAKKAATKQPASSSAASSGNCFKDWYSLFKERGATAIPDGTNDVVISIRNGEYSECFMGKVDVTAGVVTSKLLIQKVDGSYDEFDKKASAAYLNSDNVLKEELRAINNGMSASIVLADGETIRLFFYKSLGDKPKGNKKAPPVSQLVKN